MEVQGVGFEELRSMSNLLKAVESRLVVQVHQAVTRTELPSLQQAVGYSRQGVLVESMKGESGPHCVNARSHAFHAIR